MIAQAPETITFEPAQKQVEQKNLVLLNGLFGSLSNWQYVLKEFSANYNIRVPEFPLFTHNLQTSPLNKLVTFLEHFIDQHELQQVTLIGNSLGGHVAQLYALKHPRKVEKLVLAGSSGLFENTFGGTFPRIKDYIYVRERVAYTFYKKEIVTEVLVQKVFQTLQIPAKASSIISLARAAQHENMTSHLGRITCPVLLVWGVQDEITPLEVAHDFHRLLPNSKMRLINECGHVPMLEQPGEFNRYLQEFLEE